MKNILEQYEADVALMDRIGAKTLRKTICETDLGSLQIMLRRENPGYVLVLDNVEFNKKDAEEILSYAAHLF